jgi:hypothetical protein
VDGPHKKHLEAAEKAKENDVHAASNGKEKKEKKQLRQDRDGTIMVPLWAIDQVLMVCKELQLNIDDDYLEELSDKISDLYDDSDDMALINLDGFLQKFMEVAEEQAARDTEVIFVQSVRVCPSLPNHPSLPLD